MHTLTQGQQRALNTLTTTALTVEMAGRDVAGQRTTLPGGTVVNATDPARIWIAER